MIIYSSLFLAPSSGLQPNPIASCTYNPTRSIHFFPSPAKHLIQNPVMCHMVYSVSCALTNTHCHPYAHANAAVQPQTLCSFIYSHQSSSWIPPLAPNFLLHLNEARCQHLHTATAFCPSLVPTVPLVKLGGGPIPPIALIFPLSPTHSATFHTVT